MMRSYGVRVRVPGCLRSGYKAKTLRTLIVCCCLLMVPIIYTWQGFEVRKGMAFQISDMSTRFQTFLATARGNEAQGKTRNMTWNCPGMPTSAVSANVSGRLGNQLFDYANLYAFAKRNNRTAFLSLNMSPQLSPYFKISMKKMSKEQYDCVKWVPTPTPQIHECRRTQLSLNYPPYVMFIGYQGSYKCFEDYWPEIRKEFQFNETLVIKSKEKIKGIQKEMLNQDEPATVVGVHVRRTDYLKKAKERKFQVPTTKYYNAAMEYFQKQYKNVIFIISSDDTPWCESNFNRTEFKIKFLQSTTNSSASASAVEVFAILAHCDHLIFGLGSFGHWAGFLNRGQVVFCSNCYTDQSSLLKEIGDYANLFLPNWIGFTVQGKQNSTLAKWNKSRENLKKLL